MERNIISCETTQDLPDYTHLLSREGGEFEINPADRKFVCVTCFVSSGEQKINWRKVSAGTQTLMASIIATARFAERNSSLLNNYIARLEDIKGIDLNSICVAKQGAIESVYNSEKTKPTSKASAEEDAQKEFDAICQSAIRKGASDIHFSISRSRLEVRIRVNGKLQFEMEDGRDKGVSILSSAYNSMTEKGSRKGDFSEMHYLAALIERDYPGMGMFRFRYESAPENNGCYCVLRILPVGKKTSGVNYLEPMDLGFSASHASILRRIMSSPDGVLIIAGTTGSGKSTTLKNLIEKEGFTKPHKNICTIEEPIEYAIAGARQIPVVRDDNEDSKVSPFSKAIRSVMRLDPDTIMIGEIRDPETALLASAATESGHFVMTTVHASSGLNIISRLTGKKMGLSLDQVCTLGFIAGLVYQKLVPTLCDSCKIPFNPDKYRNSQDILDVEFIDRMERVYSNDDMTRLFEKGCDADCPACGGKGETGRTICAETIIPDTKMLSLFKAGDDIEAYNHWRNTADKNAEDNFQGKPALLHAIYKTKLGEVSPIDVEDEFGDIDKLVILEDGVISSSEVAPSARAAKLMVEQGREHAEVIKLLTQFDESFKSVETGEVDQSLLDAVDKLREHFRVLDESNVTSERRKAS